MKFLDLLGGALCAALFVGVAWLCLFHIEVTATTIRVVYENGDLLHKLLTLFGVA